MNIAEKTLQASANVWTDVCRLDDILPDMGVAALVGDEQVALFRIGEAGPVYALGNLDPFSNAHVLSRGIVGDAGGTLVVASPVYKQRFALVTGRCIEDDTISVPVYPVRILNGVIQVAT